MNDAQGIKTDDSGVTSAATAIAGVAKSFLDPFKDHFERKAEERAEQRNKNLSASQQGGSSFTHEQVSQLMGQSHAQDLAMEKAKGGQARAAMRQAAKLAGNANSKPGTKQQYSGGPDGSFSMSHTTGSAPRKPSSGKSAPKASPANPSRRGKK
jgi:hypothetical protein